MTIKLSEARRLCTKPELELVVSASPKGLAQLTVARLEKKLERARALRDKYANLARDQQRKTQATKGARGVGDANERTKHKAEIFGELVEKLGARKALLEERKRKEQEAAAKKAAKAAKKTPAKKTPAKKAAIKKAPRKGTVVKKPKARAVTPGGQRTAAPKATKIVQQSHGKAISGHIKSRGKRDQARRDAKGR